MAQFSHTKTQWEAMLAVKRAVAGIPLAILKEKANELKVGTPPFMIVKITFENGTVKTKSSLFGKIILNSVNTAIELADGFRKE